MYRIKAITPEWVATGIADLDLILRGGLPKDRFLVQGQLQSSR
jgi:hypothetical protein